MGIRLPPPPPFFLGNREIWKVWAVNGGTLISLFQQYPGIFVAVELGIHAIVDFEGDDCSRREWQYPESLGVQGAANEEVYLIGCVPLF